MDLKDEVRNICHTAFIQRIFQFLHALRTGKIDSDVCHFSAGIFLSHTQEYRNY